MGSQAVLFVAIAARLTAIHNLKDLRDAALASGAHLTDFRRDQTAHADSAEHFFAVLRAPTNSCGVIARIAKHSVGTVCHLVSLFLPISRISQQKNKTARDGGIAGRDRNWMNELTLHRQTFAASTPTRITTHSHGEHGHLRRGEEALHNEIIPLTKDRCATNLKIPGKRNNCVADGAKMGLYRHSGAGISAPERR
jgi:hypothetical protein